MAKYWEGSYDINTDWGGKDTGGKPLTGEMVQAVIKDELKRLDKSKVGHIATDGGRVYFSTTAEAYNKGEYMGEVVSAQLYAMYVEGDISNKSTFLSSDADKTFTWYFKTVQIATGQIYGEKVSVEYHIHNETTTKDKVVPMEISVDETKVDEDGFTRVDVDLDEYLENGVSNIQIIVKGLRTKQEGILSTRITIVTLDIEDKTEFSKTFTNTLIVATDVNCTMNQLFSYEYRFDDATDFIFDDKTTNSGKGSKALYNYEVGISHLTDGKHVFEYRIIVNLGEGKVYKTAIQRFDFIKGADYVFAEPQILFFINYNENEDYLAEDGNIIINNVTQYVEKQVKCSVYNTNAAFTPTEFYEIDEDTDSEILITTTNAERGKFFYFSMQSMDSGFKTIKVVFKDLNDNIINKDGKIFYVNVEPSTLKISEYKQDLRIDFTSVGKDNNSETDRTIWKSTMSDEFATFNETFDWSQGWTSNGLVISENSEVTFNYAPFPKQTSSPTAEEAKEYVGGEKGYTFEIEFMTQNVTDEEAVLCDMTNERPGNNCGFKIKGTEFVFETPGQEIISTRFKDGEMNRVAIVVHPEYDGENFKGLVELYVNGIMSRIGIYEKTDNFISLEEDENGNYVSKRLKFKGSAGADLVVKYVRAYNSVMKPDDAVNNYIIYRESSKEMMNLYSKNNILNDQNNLTPESLLASSKIPILVFVGRTVSSELASGEGDDIDGVYQRGEIEADNDTNWYGTLEGTTDKKKNVNMDVIYYNPLDKTKNFKFVKAYITPQGTSSMYYPKKNYRIYTQKNSDTRMFLSKSETDVLEFNQMMKSNFGETEADRVYEFARGEKSKKLYAFKNYKTDKTNSQPVKCWCLKADFAETSSSHNTGIARLWGDTMKNASVDFDGTEQKVFKTVAQKTIENLYKDKPEEMPDIRTTVDGFPIVVFGKKSYESEYVFLGQYNFNNDKSTESVFGFCKIDKKNDITDDSYDYENNVSGTVVHTLDAQLDQYMTCVETLDNGNVLANFASMQIVDKDNNVQSWDDAWDSAFEFRYPEIPEAPSASDYQDKNQAWLPADEENGYEGGLVEYNKDKAKYEEEYKYWANTHLKPFKHFAKWVYDTRWCDANGNILEAELQAILDNSGILVDESGQTITTVQQLAEFRQRKFSTEKWKHIDVWKMAAYYIYAMRFGAVDQIVKNSMLTSEGPFANNPEGVKYGEWDTTGANGRDWKEYTDFDSPEYGKYYKWYYINYDNDTIMGVKNDGSLVYGPEITRTDLDADGTPIYAGYTSTLWNNIDYDTEFQDIIRRADRGISRYLTYSKAINTFDVEQVGQWCERIYNKDAEYKYISPYMADWDYEDMEGKKDDDIEVFSKKLFMLQGSRTAHRRWWLSRRFNLFDGKWSSGDFASKYVEIKCNYGSIGDPFYGIAGANAYFGYQINNKTFGDAKGGVTTKYNANDIIDWELRKVINIGDPIAIYGVNDLLELNLQGISKYLKEMNFYFSTNDDLGNKMEKFNISIPEEELIVSSYYRAFTDDSKEESNPKTAFENLKEAYPYDINGEEDFEEGEAQKYPSKEEGFEYDPLDSESPLFYRTVSINEKGDKTFVYFAKINGGVRNYACGSVTLDRMDKLQTFNAAGYMSLTNLSLVKNKFITDVDVRYSAVGSITFAEGARIKNLKASSYLTNLVFNSCDNIKLSNIMIDNATLKADGGKNIYTIKVDSSNGLNHDNEFKNFIIKWMKSGNISAKELVLTGVKWTNVSVSELETILKFKKGDENGKHAMECIITGNIEMGSDQISFKDLEMFEELNAALGGSLNIKIVYPNIMINEPEIEIVAGESTKFSYTLFPSDTFIKEGNGSVSYYFVKEVGSNEEPDFWDTRTNKYYKKIEDTNLVRPGVSMARGEKENEIIISTEENVVGGDSVAHLMAILYYDGDTKFDVAELLIKEPTYAVNGSINGLRNVGEVNTSYDYTLSIVSNMGDEPIGTIDIEWYVDGENYREFLSANGKSENKPYISGFRISENKKVFTLTTSEEQPKPTSKLVISVKIINHNASTSIPVAKEVIVEKELLLLDKDVVLTQETNPVVFNVCKEQGWVSNEMVMTKGEAEAITNIKTAFANVKDTKGWTFEEFRYFTNVRLTSLAEGAFANSDITSIVLPSNITTLGNGTFEGCEKLKDVQIEGAIIDIPERCFLNCISLVNFSLPDTVINLYKNSFGGTNITKIIENNGTLIDGDKAILLGSNSLLNRIENNAFEVDSWSVDNSTNKLKEVVLPGRLNFAYDAYNFLLGNHLVKISLMNEETSKLGFENNILYANKSKDTLVRAIPHSNGENELDFVSIENASSVYDYAFFNCETIKHLRMSPYLNAYGLGAGVFYGSSIESIDFESSETLERIPEFTFANCAKLTEVIFPSNGMIKTFGWNLFDNCSNLSAITLPNTIEIFEGDGGAGDAYTFNNCGIEELVLPNSFLNSGRYFVNNCSKIKKLVFSDFYTSVGSGGSDKVKGCEALEEVILPIFSYTVTRYKVTNSVDVIGIYNTRSEAEKALQDGYRVEEFSDNEIVNDYFETTSPSFIDCPNILRFKLNAKDNNKIYIEKEGVLYKVGNKNDLGVLVEQEQELAVVPYGLSSVTIDDKTKYIGPFAIKDAMLNKLTSIVIPEGVVELKQYALSLNKQTTSIDTTSVLTGIILPNTLKVIGDYAFLHCNSLKELVIPETVETIGSYAFAYCFGLTNLNMPEKITNITDHAFYHCDNLKEVVLFGEVDTIGSFAFNYCTKLEKLTIFNAQAPTLSVGTGTTDGTADYHPFGYRSNMYTGMNTGKNNILYLPYGYNTSTTNGYKQELWVNPLQLETKGKFTELEYIKLNQEVVVSVIDTDGSIIDDGTLYFVSEEGDFVTSSTNDIIRGTYNNSKGGFELIFNDNVYHGETITVYKDANKQNKIGTFVAKYGVEYYEVGGVVASYSNRRMFSTTLFGTPSETKNVNDEPIQLTRGDYEALLSKIDFLTEKLNRLNKK